MTPRLLPFVLAVALSGCAPAPIAIIRHGQLTLPMQANEPQVATHVSASAAPTVGTGPTPAATEAPVSPPLSGGGPGVAGGPAAAPPVFGDPGGDVSSPLTVPEPSAFLWLADGSFVPVPEDDEVALPADASGAVSHFAPGRVPATVEIPAAGLPALHPQRRGVAEAPIGMGQIAGAIAPAGADAHVTLQGPSLVVANGTDPATGAFAFSAPLAAPMDALLVARDAQIRPGLALSRVSLAPGQALTGLTVSLRPPTGTSASPPSPPTGLQVKAAALWASMVEAATPWRALVLRTHEGPAFSLPLYGWPEFTWVLTYEATAPDGRLGSVIGGPPGDLPSFLAPPVLTGMPEALAPGTTLSWPAVPGATLYTLRLRTPGNNAPVWEAAVTRPRVVVPRPLTLDQASYTLTVEAWDASDVTVYRVAQRALRVPADPGGPRGRRSWARRNFTQAR